MVIVDTSAWMEFLRQPTAPIGREVAAFLRQNQVLMVGLVLAEVLQGARGQQAAALREQLSALPYLEVDKATWLRAAELSSTLRAQGQPTPLSDLVIGLQALAGGHTVFATDAHFQRVPGLQLHQVGT